METLEDFVRMLRTTHELAEREAAFTNLFTALRRLVFRAAVLCLGNQDDAEEAIQEAFVAVCQQYRTECWANGPALLGWMRRVVYHKCVDIHHQRSRRPLSVGIETFSGTSEDASVTLERNELVARVRAAIDDLPGDQRYAVQGCHLFFMSRAEVGEELGISANAVGMLLYRASRRLHSALGGVSRVYFEDSQT